MDFQAVAVECAPTVAPTTLQALVRVESGFNPYAIGVVNGRLERQPKNKAEAVATIKALESAGFNYSVGLGQVNKHNFTKYGITAESALEPCENLKASASILSGCFHRAKNTMSENDALLASFSCYYSGNFQTGFKPDFKGQPSYVNKILASAANNETAQPIRIYANSPESRKPKIKNDAKQEKEQHNDNEYSGYSSGEKEYKARYNGYYENN